MTNLLTRSLVHPLDPNDPPPRALIGGKAHSVATLKRLGMPTPPGFCLTTAAHESLFAAAGLVDDVQQLERRLPERTAALRLQDICHRTPLSPTLQTAIRHGTTTLTKDNGHAPAALAVRSSAIDEDGDHTSFAGLHDTHLGVAADGVARAVRACWASLWSDRAIAYRVDHELPLAGLRMAVLIQRLVPASESAVVFTRSPLTASRHEITVATARGLGEAIVAGQQTPDLIVVDRASLEIRSHDPGDATTRCFSAAPTSTRTNDESLGTAELSSLVELCLTLERRLGRYLDIEAARHAGQWWLLQARPITAGGSPGEQRDWTRLSTTEHHLPPTEDGV